MASVGRICYPTKRRLAKPPYICPDLLRRYASKQINLRPSNLKPNKDDNVRN
jgi:hypothetical protein